MCLPLTYLGGAPGARGGLKTLTVSGWLCRQKTCVLLHNNNNNNNNNNLVSCAQKEMSAAQTFSGDSASGPAVIVAPESRQCRQLPSSGSYNLDTSMPPVPASPIHSEQTSVRIPSDSQNATESIQASQPSPIGPPTPRPVRQRQKPVALGDYHLY